MGPIELADVVGLDVCMHVGDIVSAALKQAAAGHARALDALIAAKKLGRKSGEGFYVWRDGKAVKSAARQRGTARGSRGPADSGARQ